MKVRGGYSPRIDPDPIHVVGGVVRFWRVSISLVVDRVFVQLGSPYLKVCALSLTILACNLLGP